MITIRLLDARRGLNRKCEELFGDAKIAEAIYRFLCDGIEECEDAEPEPKWIPVTERLPEVGKFVLVNDIYMDELTIAKLLEGKDWEDQHGNWSSFGCVSAWMPLPEVYGG